MKPIIAAAAFLLLLAAASVGFGAEGKEDPTLPGTNRLSSQTQQMMLADTGDPLGSELVRLMHNHGFSDHLIEQARKICEQAQQKDLPIDPLLNKAREGISKGAGPELILTAMEKVRQRHAFAAQEVAEIP